MNHDLKTHLSNILHESITRVSTVSGGDISKAFRVDTPINSYFLKVNHAPDALQMFQTEANGLQLIRETNTIKTPKVLSCSNFKNAAYLLMEFIESKSPSSEDFQYFGHQLSELHTSASHCFGLNENNFIGSLAQSNKTNQSWVDFYTLERLLPQLELAKQRQLLSDKEIPSEQQLKDSLYLLFTNVKPVLLHGDLWRGNYLISNDGTPYLIDPAAYYGHHEVDIAMTKLFGGFSEAFYHAYSNQFPLDKHTELRIEIYQLYYLLVHLNLFGSSYYASVSAILKAYF